MNSDTSNVISKICDSASVDRGRNGGDFQSDVSKGGYISHFKEFLPIDNPIFSGGFGLAVLGIGTQILRKGSAVGMQIARKNLLVTLEVTSKDKSYPWVLQWLTMQGTRTQHLSVETTLQASQAGVSTSFGLVPSPGFHVLRFRNRFLGVERMREQQMMDLNTGKPWEKVQFTGIGRDTSIFEHILRESYEMASAKEEGKTIVYTNWGTEWRPFGQPRTRRQLNSVILDSGLAEKIDEDICEWQESAGWYRDRGIPYRRGYLLYGPPGSGKTSFIMALAGKLKYNICVLNLAERGLTDDRLAVALSAVPPQCIVLLEDVDVAFPRGNRSTQSASSGGGGHDTQSTSEVTFSGLLNILDGAVSSEERLIFMTTNYVNRLDPALVRPGRVDMAQYVGDASKFQVEKMFRKFYPDAAESLLTEFVQQIPENTSMAQLQGFFLRYKDDPQAAVDNVSRINASIVHTAPRLKKSSSADEEPAGVSGNREDNEQNGEEEFVDEGVEERDEKSVPRSRVKRMLTAHELDKMVFNPQYDWEKDIYTGPK